MSQELKRTYKTFDVLPGNDFCWKVLHWARRHFSVFCSLNDMHEMHVKYRSVSHLFALGVADQCLDDQKDAFKQLRLFHDRHHDWLFGFLTYELKDQLEQLQSCNQDGIGMPGMHFFRPVVLIRIAHGNTEEAVVEGQPTCHSSKSPTMTIGCLPGFGIFSDPDQVYRAVMDFVPLPASVQGPVTVRSRVSRDRYMQQVQSIREHILRGDIYEMNYCIEFFDPEAQIDPLALYVRLTRQSPTPFSCFYFLDGKVLLCASPERFMKKQGTRLISQPIKGTIARGKDLLSDKRQKAQLYHDPKERSENVMIVDLVRNDLSHTARAGSVIVEELFGIYPFQYVHQMISTVVSELDPAFHPVDAIRCAFPMGSMTGAPKVRAMQLIEIFEESRRGLYSGSVGYFSPDKDFDFNVVIRSLLYNTETRYLAYMVGSAITAASEPEKEYEECLLKAEGIKKAIENDPDEEDDYNGEEG